ncbi:helix-turn-helix domain-containing protein [Xenorhabdus kozodoii]|uniref:ATP-dependent transcriptional regulator LuxR n=1 Tax=Xenorhabdus kozodoii TaxID=351676 RepID=A0A2D0L301_9GAMM|nr:ATP-dependent transcriptional regulator LuxR [Xenorhabdus kozodoii]
MESNLYSDYRPTSVLLTKRESQILFWVSQGKTYYEIGVILSISESTVKFHVGNIFKKLGTVNMKQSLKFASYHIENIQYK